MNTVAECIMSTSYYEQIDHHLTEQAIQQFLQASRAYETVHNYGAVTGLIASRLMQIAHEHGTNQFQFDMNGIKPIDLFGSFLSPQKGHTINLLVYGELGEESFHKSTCNSIVEEVNTISEKMRGECSIWEKNTEISAADYCSVHISRNEQVEYFYFKCWNAPPVISQSITEDIDDWVTIGDDVTIYIQNYASYEHLQPIFEKNDVLDSVVAVNQAEFEKLWRPSIPYFKKMDNLFRGRK